MIKHKKEKQKGQWKMFPIEFKREQENQVPDHRKITRRHVEKKYIENTIEEHPTKYPATALLSS